MFGGALRGWEETRPGKAPGPGRELEALLNVLEGWIQRLHPQSYKMRLKSVLQVESTFLSFDLRTAPSRTPSGLAFPDV